MAKKKTGRKEASGEREIPFIEVDLSGPDLNTADEANIIARKLRRRGVSVNNSVFTGIDGRHIPNVLRYGADRPDRTTTWYTTSEMLTDAGDGPIFYANDYQDPAIVVYERASIHSGTGKSDEGTFKRRPIDAVRAVVRLKYRK